MSSAAVNMRLDTRDAAPRPDNKPPLAKNAFRRHNMIMEEALGARVVEGVREATELSVGDFDGCRFKLVCAPEALGVVTMHVDLPCWRELSSLGGQAALDEIFAGHVAAPDPGYKVAVRVDCDAVAAADRPALSRSSSTSSATSSALRNDPAKPASYDRVAVVYAIDFPRRRTAPWAACCSSSSRDAGPGAPVTFSEAKAPPLEIRDLVATSGFLGFGGKKLPSVVGYVTSRSSTAVPKPARAGMKTATGRSFFRKK
ncbi:hypothetical protein JL720_5720 [Aureococcus anophagefferens]|nr:hypothetical protein JL720_5720 [Aureococcus anophagefferens]